MNNAINWKDEYFISKDRIVLTNHEIQVPGIRILAHHSISNAILPLLPHFHENAFEFTMMEKGNMSFYTDDREYDVHGGSVFVSFPNEIHSTNGNPLSQNSQYWIQIDISDPAGFLFLEKQPAESLIQSLYSIHNHMIIDVGKAVSNALSSAFNIAKTNGSRLLIASNVQLFLELLVLSSGKAEARYSPDIQVAVEYIDTHIMEGISLEEVAGQCNLSLSHFKQKFRNVVGTSPGSYINEKKISRAKELLKKGYSVTDTAMMLSFNSSSYFSTVFKKYTMVSPYQYIESHRKHR